MHLTPTIRRATTLAAACLGLGLTVQSGVVAAAPTAPVPAGSAASKTTLRAAAPRGFVVGTAISTDRSATSNAAYQRVLATQFGSITPDRAMKWGMIHTAPNQYNWKEADRAVAQARSRGQLVRGHTLLWHGALPQYVKTQTRTCPQAKKELRTHITTVVGHYRGKVWQWDVANELINDQGKYRQENPFVKACGPGIVADAFRWAHAADPKAKLYLNDDNTLNNGRRAGGQYTMVRNLVKAKVPIHGVGFQAHLKTTDGLPKATSQTLDRYAKLGLDVMITEADVRMPVPAKGRKLAQQQAKQAQIYSGLLDACRKQKRCKGFTIWGFTDRWGWVEQALPGQGAACVMDSRMRPRPAWNALHARLRQR